MLHSSLCCPQFGRKNREIRLKDFKGDNSSPRSTDTETKFRHNANESTPLLYASFVASLLHFHFHFNAILISAPSAFLTGNQGQYNNQLFFFYLSFFLPLFLTSAHCTGFGGSDYLYLGVQICITVTQEKGKKSREKKWTREYFCVEQKHTTCNCSHMKEK